MANTLQCAHGPSLNYNHITDEYASAPWQSIGIGWFAFCWATGLRCEHLRSGGSSTSISNYCVSRRQTPPRLNSGRLVGRTSAVKRSSQHRGRSGVTLSQLCFLRAVRTHTVLACSKWQTSAAPLFWQLLARSNDHQGASSLAVGSCRIPQPATATARAKQRCATTAS